jgi:hypothetical protein
VDIIGDGLLTEAQSTHKEFDLDGDGTTDKYRAWFQAEYAVLTFDSDGDELFGNYSNFIENDTSFNNDYGALHAFANQVRARIDDDGKIDQEELA